MKIQSRKTGKIEFITPEEWAKIKSMGDQSKFKILDAKAERKEVIIDIDEIELKEIKPKRKKHGSK